MNREVARAETLAAAPSGITRGEPTGSTRGMVWEADVPPAGCNRVSDAISCIGAPIIVIRGITQIRAPIRPRGGHTTAAPAEQDVFEAEARAALRPGALAWSIRASRLRLDTAAR